MIARVLAVAAAAAVLAGCGSQAASVSATTTPRPAAACPGGAPRIQETSGGQWVCDPDGPVTPTAQPSQPAPVSTAATLTGTCVMGWEWVPNTTNAATGMFESGSPLAETSAGDSTLAYQVTLTSTSGATASVGGLAVAFYAGTAEAGSDQEQATGLITAGQSLSWTFIEDHTVHGFGDDPDQALAQTADIPAGAGTCSFVQWSQG